MSQDFKFCLEPSLLYIFGMGPLRGLGDSADFLARFSEGGGENKPIIGAFKFSV